MAFLPTLLLAAFATSGVALTGPRSVALTACEAVAKSASSAAAVYYPADTAQYDAGIAHEFSSSTQLPVCVFEPATPADVSIALKVIAELKVPFAVKGGGHASNPGFSSTTGLHISMTKFSQITLSKDKSTLTIGSGLIWDQVYNALNGTGVNVVGGRVPTVGVAGVIAGGGGYSWLSNQHGLSIDTVVAFNLVLPSGAITTVTSADQDLFFALKGCYNNYGIITSFVLKTFPQPATVFGGARVYDPTETEAVMSAIHQFTLGSTDPRVQILPTINTISGVTVVQILMFFDGPEAELPKNSFQFFDGLTTLEDSVQDQSFASFFNALPYATPLALGARGVFNTVPLLSYSPAILQQLLNQTAYYATQVASKTGIILSYDIEPFLSSYFDNSQGGAYPHSSASPVQPLNVYFGWNSTADDAFWVQAAIDTAAVIKSEAIAEGQRIAKSVSYPNYAVAGTPLQSLYGSNVARLMAIKKEVDPTNIMGLAGGFKIPV